MPRVYGNASRAGVIGLEGIEVPIEPLMVSNQLEAARRERQAAAIAAAASPPARAGTDRAAAGRRQGGHVPAGPSVPVDQSVPALVAPAETAVARTAVAAPPAPAVPVLEVIEDLAPAGPVPCQASDCG